MNHADRFVGWKDRHEWSQVYHWLYNTNWQLQELGIERIAAWKSKCKDKLPISIECTSSLVRAYLNDVRHRVDHLTARLTYSMALVRFINSMTDLQQKKLYARPVHVLASTIGLPDWIVYVRHEATHAELPSLDVLRTACNVALAWLRDQYWKRQLAIQQQTEDLIAKSLELYWLEQIEMLQKKKSKKTQCTSPKALAIVKELISGVPSDYIADALIPTLISNSPFFPDQKHLKQLGLDPSNFDSTSQGFILPPQVILVWEPMLHLFQAAFTVFLPTLLKSLLLELTNDHNNPRHLKCFFITAWIRFALLQIKEGNFITGNDGVNWWIIAKLALQCPNFLTLDLIDIIYSHLRPAPSEKVKEKLRMLVQIYLGHADELNASYTQSQGNQEESLSSSLIEKIQNARRENVIFNATNSDRTWKLSKGSSINWCMRPIGSILNESDLPDISNVNEVMYLTDHQPTDIDSCYDDNFAEISENFDYDSNVKPDNHNHSEITTDSVSQAKKLHYDEEAIQSIHDQIQLF